MYIKHIVLPKTILIKLYLPSYNKLISHVTNYFIVVIGLFQWFLFKLCWRNIYF